ncbi:hypothetical protein KJ567_01460, partial [Candidatus Bipolaricaulota bacterium]|nr:hypothetical protein [Candidatus Bipolaricaulota bacterium]
WLGREGLEPELAGSAVSTYQEGRYTGDSDLSRLFEIGRSLLEQYRRGQLPASEVFDLRRMAAFFLTGGRRMSRASTGTTRSGSAEP